MVKMVLSVAKNRVSPYQIGTVGRYAMIIIIIQVIYIALFTAASQRLQFTNRKKKENTSKTSTSKRTLLSKKKGF